MTTMIVVPVTATVVVVVSPVVTTVSPPHATSATAPVAPVSPVSPAASAAGAAFAFVVHAWDVGRGLLALLFLLALLVVDKVVEDRCHVVEGVDDLQHRLGLVRRHLLGVAAVGHRLVLVVLQPDVPQLHVGHVLDVYPFDL